jgi:pimeloyl-ACP methyl ester carboxylesterase
MLSLLLRAPSVALAARRFQGRFLRPSLAALDRGDLEGAARLNVEGVQDSPGALGRLSEEERKMMVANARTVGELRTVFPRFTGGHAALISCRTLVVNGESSPLWLRRIGELTAGSIPGARRTLVAGSRHFPHMENPAEFNRKALEFLGEAKRR